MTVLKDKLKCFIFSLRDAGYSQVELAKKFCVSQGTVSKLLKKNSKYGTVARLPGSGRPLAIDEAVASSIREINSKNSKTSLRKMSAKVNLISEKTTSYLKIISFIIEKVYMQTFLIKKAILNTIHIKKRLQTGKT